MKELLLVIALFGLAYIVGHSKISLPVRVALSPADADRGALAWFRRMFVEMIECVACFGFWEGIAVSYFGLWVPFGGGVFQTFCAGCLIAGTNLLLGAIARLT